MKNNQPWLQRCLEHWPLFVVFLVALIVRLGYYAEMSGSVTWQWERWPESDMDTLLAVAGQILDGDILVREPYHPIHGWHQQIASTEDWRAWVRPHVFYQVPGYYYLLALFAKLFNGSVATIKLLQLLLGAFHAALLGAVGHRMMGRIGGLVVGLLAAVYGPFIAAEAMLLRESIGLLQATLAFYFTLKALELFAEQRHRAAGRLWFISGLVLGLGAITKETGFVLFGAIWIWLIGRSLIKPGFPRYASLLVLVGFLLGVSPVILRNLAVGAPPLAMSSNAGLTFMLGNAADLPSGGVIFYEDAPSFKTIVQESHGDLLPSVILTLHTYSDRPGLFLWNVWQKFSAIWSNVELPDNYSYEHLSLHSALLSSLPRFVWVFLPAVLGLVVLTTGWGARSRIIPFPRAVTGLVLVILGIQTLALSLAPVTARYRMVIVPFLMLPAGWALAEGFASIVLRRWTHLAQLSVLFTAITLAWLLWPSDPRLERQALRPDHFGIGGRILLELGAFSAAHTEYDLGINYFTAHGDPMRAMYVRRDRLLEFTSQNHSDEVRDDWELLSKAMPDDPVVRMVGKRKRRQLHILGVDQ